MIKNKMKTPIAKKTWTNTEKRKHRRPHQPPFRPEKHWDFMAKHSIPRKEWVARKVPNIDPKRHQHAPKIINKCIQKSIKKRPRKNNEKRTPKDTNMTILGPKNESFGSGFPGPDASFGDLVLGTSAGAPPRVIFMQFSPILDRFGHILEDFGTILDRC